MKSAVAQFHTLLKSIRKIRPNLATQLRRDNITYCSRQFSTMNWYENRVKMAAKEIEEDNPALAAKLRDIYPDLAKDWN